MCEILSMCVRVCERGGGGGGVKIYPSNPKHTRAGI